MTDQLVLPGFEEHFTQPIGDFEPCVVYFKEIDVTQVLLRDCAIVWKPWRDLLHIVDLGYDMTTGELVGVQIWADVRKDKS